MTTHTTAHEPTTTRETFVLPVDDVRTGDVVRREDGPVLVLSVRSLSDEVVSLSVMDATSLRWTMSLRTGAPVLVDRDEV